MWKDYKVKRLDRKDINRRIEIGLSVYSKSPEAMQQAALNRLLQPAYAYTSVERKKNMKIFNKAEFLKTPIGLTVKNTIDELDAAIIRRSNMPRGYYAYTIEEGEVNKYLACWEALKVVIKQLYDIEYCFTRTSEYYGLCTEDETDYLFVVERSL